MDARTDVQQQDDRKWQLVLAEVFDLLFGVVFEQLEVLNREIADNLSGLLVCHQRVERDQIGLDPDSLLLPVFRLRKRRERKQRKQCKAEKPSKNRSRHRAPPTGEISLQLVK